MILNSLNIRRITYGEYEGQYEITVEFKDDAINGNAHGDKIVTHIDKTFHDSFILKCNEAIADALDKGKDKFIESLNSITNV